MMSPDDILAFLARDYPGRYRVERTENGLRHYPARETSPFYTAMVELDPVEGEEGTWRCRVWRVHTTDRAMADIAFYIILAEGKAEPGCDCRVFIEPSTLECNVDNVVNFFRFIETSAVHRRRMDFFPKELVSA